MTNKLPGLSLQLHIMKNEDSNSNIYITLALCQAGFKELCMESCKTPPGSKETMSVTPDIWRNLTEIDQMTSSKFGRLSDMN